MGHKARVCAAPNFQSWVESFGVGFHPIGPDLEKWTAMPMPATLPTPEQRQQLARMTVVDQFRVVAEAAQGCDLMVAGGMLQTAGRSIAESLDIPYVYVAYAPVTLPSPNHPPAKMGVAYSQTLPAEENRKLWLEEEQSFNELFGAAINEQRAALGLAPVSSVTRYITTEQPWLAADPVLGPAGTPIDMTITQTGAWFLSDPADLPEPLEAFLEAGEPPVYFGFGSMRASEQTGDIMVEAARALGRRAILSQGWAGLSVKDAGDDCISIGGVNHEKLLARVAAVVHHGGAGTTTAAARAGKPQVVVPRSYDQFYWAHRVQTLGVGVSGFTAENLTVDGLVAALQEALKPEAADCTAELAGRIQLNGARIAAERLTATFA